MDEVTPLDRETADTGSFPTAADLVMGKASPVPRAAAR